LASKDPAQKAGFFFVVHWFWAILPYTQHTERNKMNPFELRYQLLQAAKDMLEQQFHASKQIWELTNKAGDPPKFPSFQDILDRATEMNKFISESK
jgi:hypothetical protein